MAAIFNCTALICGYDAGEPQTTAPTSANVINVKTLGRAQQLGVYLPDSDERAMGYKSFTVAHGFEFDSLCMVFVQHIDTWLVRLPIAGGYSPTVRL